MPSKRTTEMLVGGAFVKRQQSSATRKKFASPVERLEDRVLLAVLDDHQFSLRESITIANDLSPNDSAAVPRNEFGQVVDQRGNYARFGSVYFCPSGNEVGTAGSSLKSDRFFAAACCEPNSIDPSFSNSFEPHFFEARQSVNDEQTQFLVRNHIGMAQVDDDFPRPRDPEKAVYVECRLSVGATCDGITICDVAVERNELNNRRTDFNYILVSNPGPGLLPAVLEPSNSSDRDRLFVCATADASSSACVVALIGGTTAEAADHSSNDVLFGGTAPNAPNQSSRDILIGGTTRYDADDGALERILSDWTKPQTLPKKVGEHSDTPREALSDDHSLSGTSRLDFFVQSKDQFPEPDVSFLSLPDDDLPGYPCGGFTNVPPYAAEAALSTRSGTVITLAISESSPRTSRAKPQEAPALAAVRNLLQSCDNSVVFEHAHQHLAGILATQQAIRGSARALLQGVLDAVEGKAYRTYPENAQLVKEINAVRGAYRLGLRLKSTGKPVYLRCARGPRSKQGTFQAISASAGRLAEYSGPLLPGLLVDDSAHGD